jgi:hypothetical protein
MKLTMPFLMVLVFLGTFHTSAIAAEPVFVCEPAKDWTALFDRTEGWIAGDGIYSFGMEGDSKQGSANEQSKTIFTFADSLIGGVNPDGSYKRGLVMVNHAVALLVGNKPDPANMRFFHNAGKNGRPSNLFDK